MTTQKFLFIKIKSYSQGKQSSALVHCIKHDVHQNDGNTVQK